MSSLNFPKLPTFIRRVRVAQDILSKKRVPYKQLGVRYEVSRRTITEDVKWIKSNFNMELLQKAVQDKVFVALDKMDDPEVILKYGLSFLKAGVPQKLAVQSEHHDVHTDIKRLEIVQLLDIYGEAVEDAVRRNIQSLTKDANKQPLDTAHTHT